MLRGHRTAAQPIAPPDARPGGPAPLSSGSLAGQRLALSPLSIIEHR